MKLGLTFWNYAGALIGTLVLGLGLFIYSIGSDLWRASYDLPFPWRQDMAQEDVVVVYLDENTFDDLGQPINQALDRKFHTQLVERLTEEGARAIFFDFLFYDAWPNPAVDTGFAAAIQQHGKVFLAADLRKTTEEGDATAITQQQILPPTAALRRACAAWGLITITPDIDRGARQLDLGNSERASLIWLMAKSLGVTQAQDETNREQLRWLNYYGPPEQLRSIRYSRVLQKEASPKDFFRNRVVFVGSRQSTGFMDTQLDRFPTPYTGRTGLQAPGVEIHATGFLNLLHNNYLTRLGPWAETGWIVAWGILISVTLVSVRPIAAVFLAPALAFVVMFGACYLQWNKGVWYAWLIPVAVQAPFALVWSSAFQYITEALKRARFRKAFSLYLSPHQAETIANTNFDLKPGGQLVEATVIFTDLEGFTSLSETRNPKEVSDLLIQYFNLATGSILDNKGTIIKYIGDAVLAAWNAPLADPDHARHAVQSAVDVVRNTNLEIMGVRLRTRVGVHTGTMLAGNLGSDFRFDYTVIGDAVNFAARLESLNKYTGTDVLISSDTYERCKDVIRTRCVGDLQVKGKKKPVTIYEGLGLKTDSVKETPWVPTWELALEAFRQKQWEEARGLFEKVKALREGKDGPSDFYLHHMEKEGHQPPEDPDWNGTVVMTEK